MQDQAAERELAGRSVGARVGCDMITKQQYRRLMSEYQRSGKVGVSAMKADVHPETARKYLRVRRPPEEVQAKHDWRTRKDPLEKVWEEAVRMLEGAPELEAKALFEHLMGRHPAELSLRHLRTFQRRVKGWRLAHGAEREVFFAQETEPGKYLEVDWTDATELGVTVGGVILQHLLCHQTLKYSNWQWANRCQSESMLSLRRGLQEGLWELGRVPVITRVDNSSAATHRIGTGAHREFNADFRALVEHYGMKAETIHIRCPNENGDVESGNRHLKRRLRQHLLLRGSQDFGSVADYDRFLVGVLRAANAQRTERLGEELAVMRALPPTRLSEYEEVYCRVTPSSTIRVRKVTYSVPSRLVGQELKVEVYEERLELYHGRERLLSLERMRGDRGRRIDWRHMVPALLRKPGAFARYRYREEFFPSGSYRRAHDRLVADHGQRGGDLEYLRLLELAAEASVTVVEGLLEYYLLRPPGRWWVAGLRQDLQRERETTQVNLVDLTPELTSYDGLLVQPEEVACGN